jgi:hypothetical protein
MDTNSALILTVTKSSKYKFLETSMRILNFKTKKKKNIKNQIWFNLSKTNVFLILSLLQIKLKFHIKNNKKQTYYN